MKIIALRRVEVRDQLVQPLETFAQACEVGVCGSGAGRCLVDLALFQFCAPLRELLRYFADDTQKQCARVAPRDSGWCL